jgi:probable HAF family extracellular repeat protein
MTDLGLLPGMSACVPTAINDSGQVVGRCTDSHTSRAFVWTQETGMNALNIPSSSSAEGINAQGDIVGWFQCSDNADCAFVYHASGALDSLDIGTAAAINDAGDAVGRNADAAARPLLWDAQGEHDLGTLGDPGGFAEAEAISADGLIVGRSSTGASGEIHAVCWTPYGLSNLGTLGGISAEAFAISGALIVGWSSTASGDTHAFVYDNNGPGYPVDLNDLIPADSGWSSSARAGSMATARSSAPET